MLPCKIYLICKLKISSFFVSKRRLEVLRLHLFLFIYKIEKDRPAKVKSFSSKSYRAPIPAFAGMIEGIFDPL